MSEFNIYLISTKVSLINFFFMHIVVKIVDIVDVNNDGLVSVGFLSDFVDGFWSDLI